MKYLMFFHHKNGCTKHLSVTLQVQHIACQVASSVQQPSDGLILTAAACLLSISNTHTDISVANATEHRTAYSYQTHHDATVSGGEPVAALFNAWVCGSLLTAIAGSKPACGTAVCFCEYYVLSGRSS
jgi:hypothetical protein